MTFHDLERVLSLLFSRRVLSSPSQRLGCSIAMKLSLALSAHASFSYLEGRMWGKRERNGKLDEEEGEKFDESPLDRQYEQNFSQDVKVSAISLAGTTGKTYYE